MQTEVEESCCLLRACQILSTPVSSFSFASFGEYFASCVMYDSHRFAVFSIHLFLPLSLSVSVCLVLRRSPEYHLHNTTYIIPPTQYHLHSTTHTIPPTQYHPHNTTHTIPPTRYHPHTVTAPIHVSLHRNVPASRPLFRGSSVIIIGKSDLKSS